MELIIFTEFIVINYYFCQIKAIYTRINKLYLSFFPISSDACILSLKSSEFQNFLIYHTQDKTSNLSYSENIPQSRKRTGGKALHYHCIISCLMSFDLSSPIICFCHPLPLGSHLQLEHPWVTYWFWNISNKQYTLSACSVLVLNLAYINCWLC